MKAKVLALAFAMLMSLSFAMSVHAATPEEMTGMYGGDLKIAVKDTLLDLDPGTATDEASWHMIDLLYDSLGRLDPVTLEVVPWVAESWTVDAETGNVTVILNPNAQWHDGTPVTASDVEWTYAGYSVTVISSTEVVFSFSSGGGKFMTEGLQKPLVKQGEANPTEGCGPFQLEERVAGDHVTIRAYEGYFKGRPYLDTVEYTIYPDIDTAANALINQTIDFIGWTLKTTDPTDERYENKTIIDQEHLAVVNNRGFEYLFLGYNPTGELGDQGLRKAAALLINKDLHANIEPNTFVTHSPMTKFNEPWYNYSLVELNAGYFFDPTGRQATNYMPGILELERLNYFDRDNDGFREKPDGSPLAITMLGPSSTEDLRKNTIAVGYQVLLSQVGLDVTYSSTGDPSDFDIYLDVGKLSLEPADIRNIPILADYNDPDINAALDAADNALDIATRQMYVHQALGLISEKVPFVPTLSYDAIESYNREMYGGWVNMVGGVNNFWSFMNLHKIQAGSLSVSVSTSFPSVDSGNNVTVTVRVLDHNDNSVEGVNVELSADSGSFASSIGTTDSLGTFETNYTASSVIDSTDVKIVAVAFLQTYEGASASTYVTVHPIVNRLEVDVSRLDARIDSGNATTVTVVITDQNGLPVDGCTVHMVVDHAGAALGTPEAVPGSPGEWTASFTGNVTTETSFRVTATAVKEGYEAGTGFTNIVVRMWGGIEPEEVVKIESIPDVGIVAVIAVTLLAVLVMASYRRRER